MLEKASTNPMRNSESSISSQICAFNGYDLVSHRSVLPQVELTLSREALTADPEAAGELQIPVPGWVIHGNGSVSQAGSPSFRQRGADVMWKA